jgi:phosphoribosylformylglycinamidine cyclo-ligase
MDYTKAGVDIAAGEELVDRIKPAVARTRTPGVLSEIGLFGGFFDARFPGYDHPVLVASTDGVGTKLKVAFMTGNHGTVGQCLVNHCVNDILACGAKPLFFLDYFATGKLDPQVGADVVIGLAQGCEQNGCALLGGETAEMPSMYAEGEYDVAGTVVGVVERQRILNGSRVQVGDVLIGLPSTGLHTNGYSLARAALFPAYTVDQYVDELGTTVGDALLAVHRSYLHALTPLLQADLISGLSHITGGGMVGNTSRILQSAQALHIEWNAWKRPPIFDLIQHAGSVAEEEMRRVFNLGIGMIAIVPQTSLDAALGMLEGQNPVVIGSVTNAVS